MSVQLPGVQPPLDKKKAVESVYSNSMKPILRHYLPAPPSKRKMKSRAPRKSPAQAATEIIRLYSRENDELPRVQTARDETRTELVELPQPPNSARPAAVGDHPSTRKVRRPKPSRHETGLIYPRPKIPSVLGPREEPAALQFKNNEHHPRVNAAADAYMFSSPSPRRSNDGKPLSHSHSAEDLITQVFGDNSEEMKEYVERFAQHKGEEAPSALRILYEGLRKRDPRLAYEWDQSWVTNGDHPFLRGFYTKLYSTSPQFRDPVTQWGGKSTKEDEAAFADAALRYHMQMEEEARNAEMQRRAKMGEGEESQHGVITVEALEAEEGEQEGHAEDEYDAATEDGDEYGQLPRLVPRTPGVAGDSSYVHFENAEMSQILTERSKMKRTEFWQQVQEWKKSDQGKTLYKYKQVDMMAEQMERMAEEGKKHLREKRSRDAWDRPWRTTSKSKDDSPKKSRKKSVPDISSLIPGAKKEYGRARPPSPMNEDPKFYSLLKSMEAGGPEFSCFTFRLSKLNSTDFKAITDALAKGGVCKKVVLSGVFQNEGKLASIVSRLVRKMPNVEIAYLNTIDLPSESAHQIFNAISGSGGGGTESSRLRTLFLDKNRIRKLDGFSGLLRGNRSLFLKSVSLCKNRISNDGAYQLASGLAANHVLEELYLTENLIGDKGFKEMGKSLSTNHALIILALEENPVTANGLDWFLRGFVRENRTLEDLRVGNVSVDDAESSLPPPPTPMDKRRRPTLMRVRSSSRVDMQLLQDMETLFEDSSSDMDDDQSTSRRKEKQLHSALSLLEEKNKKKGSPLSFLSVFETNVLSSSSVSCLSKLSISGDWAESESAMSSLCRGLGTSRHLRLLDLSGNKLKRKSLSMICDALKDSSSLVGLIFAGCRIGNDGATVLASFLRSRSLKLSQAFDIGTSKDDAKKESLRDAKTLLADLNTALSDSALENYLSVMKPPLLSRELSAGPVFVDSIDDVEGIVGGSTLAYAVHTPGIAFLDVSDCGISDAGMHALLEVLKLRMVSKVRMMPSWSAAPFGCAFPPRRGDEGDPAVESMLEKTPSSIVFSCQGVRQVKKLAKLIHTEIDGKLSRIQLDGSGRSSSLKMMSPKPPSSGRSLIHDDETVEVYVEVLSSIKVLRALDNEFSRECIEYFIDKSSPFGARGLHELTLSTCTSNMSMALPFPRLLQALPLNGHFRSIHAPAFLEATIEEELKRQREEERVKETLSDPAEKVESEGSEVRGGDEEEHHHGDMAHHGEDEVGVGRGKEGLSRRNSDEIGGRSTRKKEKEKEKESKKGKSKVVRPQYQSELSSLTTVVRRKETETPPAFLPGSIGGLRVASVEIPRRFFSAPSLLPDALRLAVLMGTHERLGEDSPLRRLPPALVAFILSKVPSVHVDLLQR